GGGDPEGKGGGGGSTEEQHQRLVPRPQRRASAGGRQATPASCAASTAAAATAACQRRRPTRSRWRRRTLLLLPPGTRSRHIKGSTSWDLSTAIAAIKSGIKACNFGIQQKQAISYHKPALYVSGSSRFGRVESQNLPCSVRPL
ncbi:Os06g0621300, partial [Oryza sativa Japonica Group]